MPSFKIKIGTPDGRILTKTAEADSRQDLIRQIEGEGCYLIESRRGLAISGLIPKRRLHQSELLIFNQSFLTLFKAGLSIPECLEALREANKNKYFAEILKGVIKKIREGRSFSEAMQNYPKIFPHLYTSAINTGEKTGDLIPVIEGYIEFQKRIEGLKKKIISSAVYPCILALTSVVVILFLVSFVVPSFSKIYADSNAEMPFLTVWLIESAILFRDYFLLWVIFFAFAAFAVSRYFKREEGRLFLDKVKLKAPYFSQIYGEYSSAKFSRTLGMVLASGVNIIQALEMSGRVFNNRILENKLKKIITQVKEGKAVTESMRNERLMPEISLCMLSAGERSGNLPMILNQIAEYHDQEMGHKIGIISDIIEPALMIVMGFVIGSIVLLMYLPIFHLGSNF